MKFYIFMCLVDSGVIIISLMRNNIPGLVWGIIGLVLFLSCIVLKVLKKR